MSDMFNPRLNQQYRPNAAPALGALLCYLAPKHLWTNLQPVPSDATYLGESGLIQTSLNLFTRS